MNRLLIDHIKILFMDFDGVFSPLGHIWLAVVSTCIDFGIVPPTYQEFRRDFDEPGRDYWRRHLKLPARIPITMLEETYFRNFDAIKHLRTFFDDVHPFLRAIAMRGIELVIVSRSDKPGLRHLLERDGHHDHFHHVIGRSKALTKDEQIVRYARRRKVPIEQTAFVDDLRHNVELVAPKGVHCIPIARPPLLEGAQIHEARCGYEPIESLLDLFLIEMCEK